MLYQVDMAIDTQTHYNYKAVAPTASPMPVPYQQPRAFAWLGVCMALRAMICPLWCTTLQSLPLRLGVLPGRLALLQFRQGVEGPEALTQLFHLSALAEQLVVVLIQGRQGKLQGLR